MPPEPSAWGLWTVGATSLCLGVFVYLKNRQGPVNRSWLAFSILTAAWVAGTALTRNAPNAMWGLIWARSAQVAFSLVPLLFLQFTLALVEGNPDRLLLVWSRRAGWLFALLGLTPLMIRDVESELPFSFYATAGPFYGFFACWFIAVFLTCLGILLKAYRQRVGYRRNQLRYVILGSSVGMASFASAIPLSFGIPVPPVPQGLFVFYALMTYAIVRWRLMDISVVIKNTLLYASLYSILVGLFVVVVVFFGQLFFYGPQALDRRVLGMCVVALSIVTALVRPLDTWLRKLTDRLLFQKKYEWQKTLKEASKGMTKVTSVEKLLKLMAHFIGMRLRVTNVGILQRVGERYELRVSRGRQKRPQGISVTRGNPLLAWLEEKNEVLTYDEVRGWLRSEKLFPHRTVIRKTLEEILQEMDLLGARVCVPAFSKSQMMGLLVLGEKLSGDPFNQEDLDVLSTLASEGAIALENAQLYQQLVQRMSEIEGLYLREHRLFIHTAVALAAAVDARDPYTHGHTERCTTYSMVIADQFHGRPEMAEISKFRETLKIAALLHDIGKIGSPDEILRKPAKLTPKEMKKMQEHPVVGAIILQPIKGMEDVAKVVKTHHERYDGKGYPDGLRATEIPFMTRIISIADTFDSMTTDRPYRKRLSDTAAIKEIQECSGTQFDPEVVDAFMRAYREGRLIQRPIEATEMIA